MSIEASDFPSRLRAHVELQGANLTEDELSHLGAHYPRCAGTGQWGVREYARVTGVGAREYRVVRGSSIQDVDSRSCCSLSVFMLPTPGNHLQIKAARPPGRR